MAQEGCQCHQRQSGKFQSDVDGHQFGGGGQQHHAAAGEHEQGVVFALEAGEPSDVVGGREDNQPQCYEHQCLEEQGKLVHQQRAERPGGVLGNQAARVGPQGEGQSEGDHQTQGSHEGDPTLALNHQVEDYYQTCQPDESKFRGQQVYIVGLHRLGLHNH